MKKYDRYKSTNIDAINKVPNHWGLASLKWVSKIYSGGTPDTTKVEYWENGNIPWLNSGSVNDFVINEPSAYITELGFKNSSAKMIKKGSLVVALAGQGKTKGMAALVNIDTTGNQSLAVIQPSEIINGRFLLFYLGMNYQNLRGLAGGDQRDGLNLNIIGNLKILIPSKKEQNLIGAYLYHKTSLIDSLIAKNQKQIDLLEEKKQAMINKAVTKGLDPNAKMKDSGVEWIGKIPEHWEVVRIRRLTRVKRGASPRPIENPIYFEENGEYAWVRIADVTASFKYLEVTTQRLSELGASLSVKMSPGDLFLSIAGTVGKPIISKIKCCIHDGFVYFPDLKVDKEFLYYIFSTGRPYMGLGKMGTQLNLNTDTVADISIPLPKENEVNDIVNYIIEQSELIDKTMNITSKTNKFLLEYRQTIISNVVTGKIDVRDEKIPEEFKTN